MMTVLERSLAEVSQDLQVGGTPVSYSRGEPSVCPFPEWSDTHQPCALELASARQLSSGTVESLITRPAQQPVHLTCSLI